MSDLQIVLIVLGAIIIAAVVVYNWLQERKLRENITEEFIVPKKDVLVDEFYVDPDALVEKEFDGDVHKDEIINKLHEDDVKKEPSLDEQALPSVEPEPQATAPETPAKAAVEAAPTVTESAPPPQATKEEIASKTQEAEIVVEKGILPPEFDPIATTSLPDDVHSQIDLTAFLYASKNIDKQAMLELSKTTLKDIGVKVFYHGLDEQDVWQRIDDTSSEMPAAYKQVAYSLQLADRRGPVPKPVLNKFQFAVETIGLEFSAHVEWQGKGDPATRAVDLDKFCMDVDQLVSVHLVQGETPIHGTKFKGLAEAEGLKLKHSQFSFFDDSTSEVPQYILINADGQPFTADGLRSDIVRGATFQIEIPKVANCEKTFNDMIATAQKMANSLGARMVDDNQKPLGELQIEKIRQQLKVIHATMVARGVMPGSPSSMRLFN